VKLLVTIEPIVETQESRESKALGEIPLIHGTPWIKFVIDALPRTDAARPVFVVRQARTGGDDMARVIRSHCPEAIVQPVPTSVQGTGCAALMAVEHVAEQELCVIQGNQFLRRDLLKLIEPMRSAEFRGGVIVFDSLDPRWPHVRLGPGGDVEEASETTLIGSHALAGVYYYRSGTDFIRSMEQTIRKGKPSAKGYGLAPAVNEMILAGKRVGAARIAAAEYVPMEREADIECCRALIHKSDDPFAQAQTQHSDRRAASAA
jgi:dTDP-glucose pyrophosphorylase